MPRTEPTEDATFPVYRVRAVCSKCGRKGWTNALQKYPKDAVITTPCSTCVKSWQASIEALHHQPLGVMRTNRQQKPEHKPLEHEPHWTEKLP